MAGRGTIGCGAFLAIQPPAGGERTKHFFVGAPGHRLRHALGSGVGMFSNGLCDLNIGPGRPHAEKRHRSAIPSNVALKWQQVEKAFVPAALARARPLQCRNGSPSPRLKLYDQPGGSSVSAEYPQPPYPSQKQPMPGSTGKMNPRPDHGEESYKGSGRLKGLKAIITGGDSGIGRAVAIAYAREGADVLIAYLDEHDDAHEVKALVEKEGRRSVLVAGDLRES